MKITISPILGLKAESGSDNIVIAGITMVVNAITSSTVLTAGGMYTLSGSAAITQTMPAAASVPGALFVFRSLTAFANVLTGSTGAFVNGATKGSKLTLSGSIDSSVILTCDGKSFVFNGNSNVHTIS